MKRILISMSLMAVSSLALAGGVDQNTVTASSATQACDGATASPSKAKIWGGSGAIPAAGQTLTFTRVGFDIQCSNNVHLYFQEESPNLALVASGSAKGNQSFAGSSNGGAVTAFEKCSGKNDSCVDNDIKTKALQEALKRSSS